MSVVFCVLLVTPVSALPISSGDRKLNNQFEDGRYGNYDYVYFSPVEDEADATKYPLTVWLHGKGSGKFARAQLQWYEFCNWSSDEYQQRFADAGGCFLLAPRAQAYENSWDQERTSSLKAIIDDFVAQNADHIDTGRIYIAGYSTGGSMVWSMLTAYPSYFAAGMPIAAITQPTLAGLEKLKNTPVWVFASDQDPYIITESGDILPNFQYLAGITNCPEDVRLTRFTEAFFADGTKKTDGEQIATDAEHYIWECVTYDMFMADGTTPYVCATTVDADGNELTFTPGEAVISWLSQQSVESESENRQLNFFQRIKLFFERFLAMLREAFSFLT